ncbi:MAG TPA: class I fructose-bisphosphate aldolase [Opitutaceae bacterium]|nr:class I fructose-bisphosphate aldolase [Opitutaceae bacterium]
MPSSSALSATVQAMLTPGKGLLAADESLPTIGRRFEALAIPSTEENRRAYRELLFTTPGLGETISGAILFDETLRQKTSRGVPMPEVLARQGIVPGIKVDKGTVALPRLEGEKITAGLDGLRDRLTEYRALGARFTKWRAVIAITGLERPTRMCIDDNARALALFAVLSQEAGLVPIVEPEVLMEGDHSLARCAEVTELVLLRVFDALAAHRVVLEEMLLKTGMVLSGDKCPEQAGVSAVAEATLRCLRRTVPAAVPGIVFLSGGQSADVATQHLDAICRAGNAPWTLSFSFGRALQSPALDAWQGSPANVAAAQAALQACAKRNGAALHAGARREV